MLKPFIRPAAIIAFAAAMLAAPLISTAQADSGRSGSHYGRSVDGQARLGHGQRRMKQSRFRQNYRRYQERRRPHRVAYRKHRNAPVHRHGRARHVSEYRQIRGIIEAILGSTTTRNSHR